MLPQNRVALQPAAAPSAQTTSSPHIDHLLTPPSPLVLGGFLVGVPLLCITSWVTYRHYRKLKRRRQVAKLERLWQISVNRPAR